MTYSELKALADSWPRVGFLERYQQGGQEIQPPSPIDCIVCEEPLRFFRDPQGQRNHAVCCPRCDVGANCIIFPVFPSTLFRWLAENLDMVWLEIKKDPDTYLAQRQQKGKQDETGNTGSEQDLGTFRLG